MTQIGSAIVMQDPEDNRIWVACPTCTETIEMPHEGPIPRVEDEEPDWPLIQPFATKFGHMLAKKCRYAETMTHDGKTKKAP